MTATNRCSNFGGFRCSPPLKHTQYATSWYQKYLHRRNCANLFDPASSQHHNSGGGGGGGGGFHVKKRKNLTVSQLSALATHTPSLGRVGQGAWELCLPQIN